MLKRRIRTLAVSGVTVAAAALVAMGTTGASAATMTASAPGHGTASRAAQAAAAPSGCVEENFTTALNHGYVACVAWAQILFNDLWYSQEQHPNHEHPLYLGVNQLLTTDGSYGPDTASVVGFFQAAWDLKPVDGELSPQTWNQLCRIDQLRGYTGAYWHDAGCATEPGL
jgi:peptidoglycan hydrolase-like protein with peptidoglycan-binding domain